MLSVGSVKFECCRSKFDFVVLIVQSLFSRVKCEFCSFECTRYSVQYAVYGWQFKV